MFNGLFFDDRRYDLAKVGRYKFNKKLSLSSRIAGQVAFEDIIDAETGEVFVEKDTVISEEVAENIRNAGINIVDIKVDDKKVRIIGNGTVNIHKVLPNVDLSDLHIKEYVNYEGSLLAYSDGLNLENVSFTAEDFNSQYITEANKVLNNSKVNVQENLHYNYRYSTGNMDVTIVSNLYGEQSLYYNLAYLTYLNENYVIFKHTTNNLKSEYSYTLKSILKINNKIYIVFNMLNESNLKETFSMYEFNGSKFTKVI